MGGLTGRTGLKTLLLAAAVLLAVPGCGGESKPAKHAAAIEAAIVPGADFVGRIDYRDAKKTPIAGEIRAMREERDPAAVEAEHAKSRKFEEATGLGQDDLVTILFSGDLDEIDLASENKEEQIGNINAVIGISFGREVTEEQLAAGLNVMVEEEPGAVLTSEERKGRTVYTATPEKPESPPLYVVLSKGKKAVFISPNMPSMDGLLLREDNGGKEEVPASLTEVEKELPAGSQMKTTFVIPAVLRQGIEAKVAEAQNDAAKNPGLGVALGFLAPFQKIASLSFGGRLGEKIDMGLAADLGGEAEALQAATLLQTMVLPMLKAKLAEKSQRDPQEYAEKIRVTNSGRNLRIEMNLDAEDLKTLKL